MRKAIVAWLCSITCLKSNGCNLSTVMDFVTQQPCGCLCLQARNTVAVSSQSAAAASTNRNNEVAGVSVTQARYTTTAIIFAPVAQAQHPSPLLARRQPRGSPAHSA